MIGPCTPWISAAELAERPRVCGEGSDDMVLLGALCEEATQTAYALLGSKYPGPCTATVRPVLRAGCWSFKSSRQIPLHLPVISVDEVTIDGEVVTDYHLRDGWLLTRNETCWPSSQKVHLPTTEQDTFSVTYTFGNLPPALAVRAALEIAEWAFVGWMPHHDLPNGTTAVQRQGMSLTLDPDAAPDYPLLNQAIAAYNPNRDVVSSDFYSSDPDWDLIVVAEPASS